MAKSSILGLFAGFGVEIEYMIVDKNNLNILPIADVLLNNQTEVSADELCYSNELALHVVELKTNGPVQDLSALPDIFHKHIKKLNSSLARNRACLLPTGLHPWMDPEVEFKIWPHSYTRIYKKYNEIFNCKGHGWGNVQSVHLNLPFANNEEFAKLHTAIRLLLPIIPVIAASSPMVELEPSGYVDTRLFYYNKNQKKVPILTGKVIPECYSSEQQYRDELLAEIYKRIAPYDQDKILQHEWLNSRGAIARFDRNTIEIRLMDTQESPLADLSILALIVAVLQNIVNERWIDYAEQATLSVRQLYEIYLGSIRYGSEYVIADRDYLMALGWKGNKCTGAELWSGILADVNSSIDRRFLPVVETILTHGNLAERILRALSGDFSKKNVTRIYQQLADCLRDNTIFNN